MKQMMDKAFSLADSIPGQIEVFWFLVAFFNRVIALFSEKDFYYINGYANENLLSKMSVYSDVLCVL
jgi:hypothetical protein